MEHASNARWVNPGEDSGTLFLGPLIDASAIGSTLPPHIQTCAQRLQACLGQFDCSIKTSNYPNTVIFLNETFKCILVVSNWTLAILATNAEPHIVAGMMAAQAFIYQVLVYVVERLRGKARHLGEYLSDATMGSLVLIPVTEVFFMGNGIAGALPDPGDWQGVARMASLTALGCVGIEQFAVNYLTPLRKAITRVLSPQRYDMRREPSESMPLLGPSPSSSLPLFRRIVDDGNFAAHFLFIVIWIFIFRNYPGFQELIADDKSYFSMPEGNIAEFSVSMQVCSASVILAFIVSGLKYLWTALCASWAPESV